MHNKRTPIICSSCNVALRRGCLGRIPTLDIIFLSLVRRAIFWTRKNIESLSDLASSAGFTYMCCVILGNSYNFSGPYWLHCKMEDGFKTLLGRKAMANLDIVIKSRDITFPTKVHLVKAVVFPVVIYGCENWTVKKAEHRRIDAFELWCWRRLLRVPWTAKRSNQSILKEISPGISLEGMMLKLKLQFLATSCEELTRWKRL